MTETGMPTTSRVNGTRAAFDLNRQPGSRRATKNANYFGIYDRYAAHLVGRRATIVEIGVQHGGSLDMWRNYFGPEANVIGVDILEETRRFADGRTTIEVGDQGDEHFLAALSKKIGMVDLIVDDGSHIPLHQRLSFEVLFYNNLKEGGAYVVEDCHTSYWPRYGGGLKSRGSFIEYAKDIADAVNYWHAATKSLKHSLATDWVECVTFFSSVVVFEKKRMTAPETLAVGDRVIDLDAPFRTRRLSKLILAAKRLPFAQAVVRRNPFLWKQMRRLMR